MYDNNPKPDYNPPVPENPPPVQNRVPRFRPVWCQKVLPLVYDDSLSYYEVICKLKRHVNMLVDFCNYLNEQIKWILAWIDEYEDLTDRVEALEELTQKLQTDLTALTDRVNTLFDIVDDHSQQILENAQNIEINKQSIISIHTELQALHNEMAGLRLEFQTLTNTVSSLQNQFNEHLQDYVNLSNKISQLELSITQITLQQNEILRQIEGLNTQIKNIQDNMVDKSVVDDLKEQIDNLEEQLNQLQTEAVTNATLRIISNVGTTLNWTGPKNTSGSFVFSSTAAYNLSVVWKGIYVLRFTQNGFVTRTLNVSVDMSNKFYDVDGTLQPVFAATITVRTGQSGATVNMTGPETGSGTTGTDGTYRFSVSNAGNYTFTVSKSGFVTQQKSLGVNTSGAHTIDITLVPTWVTVSWRINTNVTNATVKITGGNLPAAGVTKSTGNSNDVTFDITAPGTYVATVSKTYYVTKSETTTISESGVARTTTVTLTADPSVQIQVRDDGTPVVGANVQFQPTANSAVVTTVTGADGNATFAHATPGATAYYSVFKDGYEQIEGATISVPNSGSLTVVTASLQKEVVGQTHWFTIDFANRNAGGESDTTKEVFREMFGIKPCTFNTKTKQVNYLNQNDIRYYADGGPLPFSLPEEEIFACEYQRWGYKLEHISNYNYKCYITTEPNKEGFLYDAFENGAKHLYIQMFPAQGYSETQGYLCNELPLNNDTPTRISQKFYNRDGTYYSPNGNRVINVKIWYAICLMCLAGLDPTNGSETLERGMKNFGAKYDSNDAITGLLQGGNWHDTYTYGRTAGLALIWYNKTIMSPQTDLVRPTQVVTELQNYIINASAQPIKDAYYTIAAGQQIKEQPIRVLPFKSLTAPSTGNAWGFYMEPIGTLHNGLTLYWSWGQLASYYDSLGILMGRNTNTLDLVNAAYYTYYTTEN